VKILNEKNKNRLFILGGIFLFILSFIIGSELLTTRYLYWFAAGMGCVGLMFLGSLHLDISKIKISYGLFACWLSVGALILVSSIRFSIDWITDALMYIGMVPVFLFLWGAVSPDILYKKLSKICVISFGIYLVFSAFFFPMNDAVYAGLYNNANGAAQFLSLVFVCVLVKFLFSEKRQLSGLYLFLTGLCGALIFYTNSRTGQLCAISVLCVTLFFYIWKKSQSWKDVLVKRVFPILAAIIVMVMLVPHIFGFMYTVGEKILDLSSFINEAIGELDGELGEKSIFFASIEKNGEGFNTAGKTLDTYSAGRVSIWKEYLKNITLFGSGKEEKFWIGSRDCYYTTAHMTALTFAFRSGAICGVLYILYLSLSAIKTLKLVLKNGAEEYTLFLMGVTVSFIITSTLASINTPFAYMLTIYYYFVQVWIMRKVDEKGR